MANAAITAAAAAAARAARRPHALARLRMQRADDRETAHQLIDRVVLHVREQNLGFLRLRVRVLRAVRHRAVERDQRRRDQQGAVLAEKRVVQRVVELVFLHRAEPVERQRALAARFREIQHHVRLVGRLDDLRVAAGLDEAREPRGRRRRRARDVQALERVVLLPAQLETARGQQHRAAHEHQKRSADHLCSLLMRASPAARRQTTTFTRRPARQ